MEQPLKPLNKRAWWLVLFLIAAAALLATFFAGIHVQQARVFPFHMLEAAYKTLAVNWHLGDVGDESGLYFHAAQCAPWSSDFVEHSPRQVERMANGLGLHSLLCPMREDAVETRVEFVAGDELAEPVLVKGEFGTFLDRCPGPAGCLAVQYSPSGVVTRAWPFRPEDIAQANIVSESDYPHEHPLGWSLVRGVSTFDIALYPGGDLLVVFRCADSHPAECGVARVAPDGEPRWYRKDYSHHWPVVLEEDLALVLGGRPQGTRRFFEIGPGRKRNIELSPRCDSDLVDRDFVRIINGRGDVLEEISILDQIAASRYATALVGMRKCNPIHTNFAHVLGEDAGGAPGIGPGDLVVSMRKLNAFGILDKDDRRLKRLVRGSFHAQHGVRHVGKARFMMYDNLGTDGTWGPSRLMTVDLATGEETTLFPNDTTPAHLRDWFATLKGDFDVSADRSRVLLVDPFRGRAVEIRLSDGSVLNVFRQLHRLGNHTGLPERLARRPWLFEFHGIYYANRWEQR